MSSDVEIEVNDTKRKRKKLRPRSEETVYAFEKPLAELVADLRETSPTNNMSSGNISTFSPILGLMRRRKPVDPGVGSTYTKSQAGNAAKANRVSKNTKNFFGTPGIGAVGQDSGGDVS